MSFFMVYFYYFPWLLWLLTFRFLQTWKSVIQIPWLFQVFHDCMNPDYVILWFIDKQLSKQYCSNFPAGPLNIVSCGLIKDIVWRRVQATCTTLFEKCFLKIMLMMRKQRPKLRKHSNWFFLPHDCCLFVVTLINANCFREVGYRFF